MTPELRVTETGIKVEVGPAFRAGLPAWKPGQHLWTVLGVWQVDPQKFAGQAVHLDRENLMTIEGPGCYWCEQSWSADLAGRPCAGSG